MEITLNIPDELAKDFATLPEEERNRSAEKIIATMLENHRVQSERERKRQEVLDNLSPFAKKWRGAISENDLRELHDDRLNYLLDK